MRSYLCVWVRWCTGHIREKGYFTRPHSIIPPRLYLFLTVIIVSLPFLNGSANIKQIKIKDEELSERLIIGGSEEAFRYFHMTDIIFHTLYFYCSSLCWKSKSYIIIDIPFPLRETIWCSNNHHCISFSIYSSIFSTIYINKCKIQAIWDNIYC